MGRGFLMALLALDLLVIASSAYVLWDRVRTHLLSPPERPAAFAGAPRPPPEAAEIRQAPAPAPPEAKPLEAQPEISFAFRDPGARQVAVAGDFNGWKPEPMKKDASQSWGLKLSLAPGRYAYNFIVDEKMIRDPSNKESENVEGRKVPASVLVVK